MDRDILVITGSKKNFALTLMSCRKRPNLSVSLQTGALIPAEEVERVLDLLFHYGSTWFISKLHVFTVLALDHLISQLISIKVRSSLICIIYCSLASLRLQAYICFNNILLHNLKSKPGYLDLLLLAFFGCGLSLKPFSPDATVTMSGFDYKKRYFWGPFLFHYFLILFFFSSG